jgi:hypothetical protein
MMFDRNSISKTQMVTALVAATFIALLSSSANAQAIRCEALAFPNERMACFYYRASIAPGPSCLLCTPQQLQKPAKPVKKRRRVKR